MWWWLFDTSTELELNFKYCGNPPEWPESVRNRKRRRLTWKCRLCLFVQAIPTVKGPLPLPTSIASGSPMSSSFFMPFLHSGAQQCTVTLPALYHKSGSSAYFGMDTFDSLPPTMDSLDTLGISDFKQGTVSYHVFLLGLLHHNFKIHFVL